MAERLIDLTHCIEDGLVTDSRLPPVHVRELWTREDSAKRYAPGVSFQISTAELCQNTATYVDCPWHRYAEGRGVWNFPLERLVNVPTIVVDVRNGIHPTGEIEHGLLESRAVSGAALLVCSGRSTDWGVPSYRDGSHPWISERTAKHLVRCGVTLYGIDTLNADRFSDLSRPVHSVLLGAEIPIIENLCNLEQVVGQTNARLFAAPLKMVGFGSCPVRAFVLVD